MKKLLVLLLITASCTSTNKINPYYHKDYLKVSGYYTVIGRENNIFIFSELKGIYHIDTENVVDTFFINKKMYIPLITLIK